jgi:DNA-binding ferritin-like protein (Dps family)
MSDKRTTSRDNEETKLITTTATRANEVNDIIRDNNLRIVDEVAKIQPQFAQSISNLQLDYIQAVRSIVQAAFANQKQVVVHAPNTPQALQVLEESAKQSTEVTNSIIRSVGIFNQLVVTALDSARENVKNYGRTVDALTDFNNNILKAWTSYWSSPQQQQLQQQLQQQFYRA